MPNMRENADRATGFRWFLMNTGSWFGAWGMQQVLFSWIVVGELQASGDWVGLAQTSIMLPSLVLLMAGGAVADRTPVVLSRDSRFRTGDGNMGNYRIYSTEGYAGVASLYLWAGMPFL